MTSLTTFLLGNFFFNLKQLSKFEWVFLFFFLTQIWHLTKKRKKKAKWREKIRNKWTRPSKQKKLCWRNKSREKKKNFSPHSQVAFFFLVTNDNKWPMTTSVSFWDKLDLLARMIVLKKKETIRWPNASEVVGEFNQKKTTLLPSIVIVHTSYLSVNWKKKRHFPINFNNSKKSLCFDLSISVKTRFLICPSN